MATTVATIGKLVGCSSATVSRVMNSSGSVNPQIRQAVLAQIARTGYQRGRTGRRGRPAGTGNQAALRLVELLYFRDSPLEKLTVRQGSLAVASPAAVPGEEMFTSPFDLSSSFYRQIVDGMVQELSNWNYRGVIRFTADLDANTVAEANKPDHAGVLLMGQYSPLLARLVESCVHPDRKSAV